uniref:WH2 domain-containing protein n=1 Tax=Parascaris univalens TaxID=6257 RepID=A0A915BKR9_PARUN
MAPPPPPPPPPPPSGIGGGHALPPKSNERSKLLSEIQAGTRLRKTVTNDRSAPMIDQNARAGNRLKGALRGGLSGPQGLAVPAKSGGSSSLFLNGVPRKPSDNRRPPIHDNSSQSLRPALPFVAKPPSALQIDESVTSLQSKATYEVHPDMKPSSASHMDSAEANSGSGSWVGSRLEQFNQKQSSAQKPSESEASSVTPHSWIGSRLEQFSQNARPPLAPPTPPSAKTKPTLPGMPPVKNVTPNAQFKTLRNMRNGGTSGVPQLRRSGSSEDIRGIARKSERPDPPPLPANPPNSARITKPAYRPPPPPSQPPRVNRIPGHQPGGAIPPPPPPLPPPIVFSPPLASNPPMPLMAQVANFAKIDDDDAPPPPPPPRGASCCSELMERFKFIPISELPQPARFSGLKKVYDYHAGRKNANALAAQ